MATEGNLSAPTRHAIDSKNPDYYNEEATFHEMERIFDICHGCRLARACAVRSQRCLT